MEVIELQAKIGELNLNEVYCTDCLLGMAKWHKRQFIGFDISEEYVEIAKERIKMLEN